MNVIFARSEIDERLFISAFASPNHIYKMQQPREAKPGTSLPCCARTHVNAAYRVPKIGKLLKNVKHRQNPSSIQATTQAHIRLREGVSANAVPEECFRQKSKIAFQNETQQTARKLADGGPNVSDDRSPLPIRIQPFVSTHRAINHSKSARRFK